MKYLIYTVYIFLMICLPYSISFANLQDKIIQIDNEFIKVIVNKGPYDLGRFSIETTKGDPQNPNDDNELLIYGRPTPWTSYTTVRLNNKNFIFGGKSKKTERRLGIKANYGEVILQKQFDDEIITMTMFDKIQVTQRLSLIRNPITKVKDTVQISYTVLNNDDRDHQVGIRMMLDTKLGSNDGAPFRIGDKTITSELRLDKDQLSDYWLTFDSLVSPNVIAQGTLYDEVNKIGKPDYLILSNWGTLVDFPWSFKYKASRSFIRSGETEKDTALGLYWDPITVKSNEKYTVSTLYGLGELSVSPGDMSLGLTAPKEIPIYQDDSFLVMGYISNSGGFDAYNIDVKFNIPAALKVVKGKTNHSFKQLKSGKTVQIPLRLRPKSKARSGYYTIQLSAQSTTLEPNQIEREIKLLSPPYLNHSIEIVPVINSKNIQDVNFYDINLRLKNKSKHTIKHIVAELNLTGNIQLIPFEINKKMISKVYTNSHYDINWRVKKNQGVLKRIPINISVNKLKEKSILAEIFSDTIGDYKWELRQSRTEIPLYDYFYIAAGTTSLTTLFNEQLIILYNPKQLKYLHLSKHPDIKQKINIKHEPGKIKLFNITAQPEFNWDHVLKFYFKSLKEGETQIELINIVNNTSKTVKIIK